MNIAGIKSILPNFSLNKKGLWTGVYFLITVCLFFLRAVLFAADYGSIEHDSGWYLGVAKNLAKRGIYASYTNTVVAEGAGIHQSIHGRPSIQDEDGFSYFPPGVTVGPGYVLPQALLLRIFGDGWWQYRLWPLITYAGLLFLLFYIVWIIGGIFSLVLFQIWLWAIPQLTITLSYEAFSEHLALFYVLICFLLWLKGVGEDKRYIFMFLAGMFLSFAVLTKLLFFLTIFGLIPMAAWELFSDRKRLKRVFLTWAMFISGFLLPIVLFELYRYIAITTRFGLEAWQDNNKAIIFQFLTQGSGAQNIADFNWAFIIQKLKIWPDVGMRDNFISWILFLVSPLLLVGRVDKKQLLLALILYGAAVTCLLWFVLASPTGWTRHAWQGLFLGMVLICGGLGVVFRDVVNRSRREALISLLVLIMGFGLVVKFDYVEVRPFLNERSIDKWHFTRSYRKRGILLLGLPHAAIFSFPDQQQTVRYLENEVNQSDRVYYIEPFLVAEISSLVDKVFYPLSRYYNNECKNSDGGESFLIIGPYQQTRWSWTKDDYAEEKVTEYCESIVLANDSYIICRLKGCSTKE